jgi:hypothetical protein
MKKQILSTGLAAVILAMAVLISPELTLAQTEKVLHRKDMHGQTVHTPYISYDEYQDVSLTSQSASDTTVDKSTGMQVNFDDLLSVSSLDEVIRHLGKPKSIDRKVFPDGERFIATLDYGGMTLKYAKRKDKNVKLTTIEMRSPNWLLKVGETEFRPGMTVNQLSPTVRQSIDEDTFLGDDDVDGVAVIRVAEPGTASGENVKIMEGEQTQISVHVNKGAKTVKVVRFHRIV